jgi:hypothetical protein
MPNASAPRPRSSLKICSRSNAVSPCCDFLFRVLPVDLDISAEKQATQLALMGSRSVFLFRVAKGGVTPPTMATLLPLLVLLGAVVANAQTTISLNPNNRSHWAVTPHFSSQGIEFLNHEVTEAILLWLNQPGLIVDQENKFPASHVACTPLI